MSKAKLLYKTLMKTLQPSGHASGEPTTGPVPKVIPWLHFPSDGNLKMSSTESGGGSKELPSSQNNFPLARNIDLGGYIG